MLVREKKGDSVHLRSDKSRKYAVPFLAMPRSRRLVAYYGIPGLAEKRTPRAPDGGTELPGLFCSQPCGQFLSQHGRVTGWLSGFFFQVGRNGSQGDGQKDAGHLPG